MIERRKTSYELEQEREARAVGLFAVGCTVGIFAFLVGFLMGWVANGMGI